MKVLGKNDYFPFGKYKDCIILDIFVEDVEYLVWAIMNVDRYDFSHELREMVFLASSQKCKNKHGFTSPNAQKQKQQDDRHTPYQAVDNDEIKSDYRKLSKFAHPDMGGNVEIMQIVNKWYVILTT